MFSKIKNLLALTTAVLLLSACGGGGDGAGGTGGNGTPGGGGTASSCAGASFIASVSYPATLSGTTGTAIAPVSPTNNLPASCAGLASYAVTAGSALPAGLSLNASTGVISGTPTAAASGAVSITMSVTGYNPIASNSVSVAVVNASAATKTWTFMVYIAGDNSLSEFALADLAELKAATQNTNVNIVVQMEYNSTYAAGINNGGLASRQTYRGQVTGASTNLTNLGNKNMSDPAELTSFINWAKTNHPAQQYALVLWSHGGGWKQNKGYRGALQDENSNGWMNLAQLRQGVANAFTGGTKLDVLAFDACLMAQYEVAYELRNTAKYLVSSEELVPGPGMPYTQVANLLTSTPTMMPIDFAKGMATKFKDSYASNSTDNTTMSVIDLSTMDALHSKLLDFSTAAQAAVSGNAAVFSTARSNAITFGGSGTQAESIDLWKYASDVAAALPSNTTLVNAATALQGQIANTSVVQKNYTGSLANAKGLAIYYPGALSQFDSGYQAAALSNTATSGKKTWYEFLSSAMGSSGASYTAAGNMSYYITWTTAAGVKADVDLAVNEPAGNWAAPWIGSTSPNGVLSADSYYSGQNFESYTANATVQGGQYDVFVNLYGCTNSATGAAITGAACAANVTFCSKVGAATSYICGSPVAFDKRPSATYGFNFYNDWTNSTVWNAVVAGNYWDWWRFNTQSRNNAGPRVVPAITPKMLPLKPTNSGAR